MNSGADTGRHTGSTLGRAATTILPPAFFTLLTAAAFHPLTFHLRDKSLPGYNDKYIFLWDL